MANRLFSASKYGHALYNAAGARKLTVSTMGESHGQSSRLGQAIQYACWRYYNADIHYDHRNVFSGTGDGATTIANAGSGDIAVGASTTAHLLAQQLPQFQASPTDIAFISSGYNDQPASAAALTTTTGRVITVADALFEAGAKFVVILGMVPRNVTNGNKSWQGYNFFMRKYCAERQGAFFLDATSVLADRQNTSPSAVPYRDIGTNAAGTYQSMTDDGTHYSRRATQALAPLIANILQNICAKRTPRLSINAGNYDPTQPYTNILGEAGNIMGTAGLGTSGGLDTGVAGTGTASRLRLEQTGTGYTLTPTIGTGTDGNREQIITFGGAGPLGGSTFFQLACTPTITGVNGGVATRMTDMECMIQLTGVTGLSGIQLRQPGPSSAYYSTTEGSGSNTASMCWPDLTTETLFCYNLFPAPLTSGNNPGCAILFQIAKVPVGAIKVSRMSVAVVDE